ncbi:MAG: hypothetical protein KJ598_04830 [Nanoarchaeota archaeon]|nr:hypothetical protein [Nanoarchaeota archaeon]
METIELTPNQIITLNDYPVYSDSVLSEYFTKCKLGEEVPFVPVIRKEVVRKYFDDKLLEEFERFEHQNPVAEYFMLDGSHRTTALTLAGCKITAIIYETDSDIKEAKKLVATGQILQNGTLDDSLIGNCEDLNRHFREKPYFMTVEQKTEKMKREKKLPQEITNYYK